MTSDGGRYVVNEFQRRNFPNHRFLGNTDKKNFEKNITAFFNKIGIDIGCFGTGTDTLLWHLRISGYPIPDENSSKRIFVIIPVPDKGKEKRKGHVFKNRFNLIDQDFTSRVDVELDVHMTDITVDVKDVRFWMDIPEYIYNKCMEDPDVEKRPASNFIDESSLAALHGILSDLSMQADAIETRFRESEKNKKMLVINYSSAESAKRDDLNHAYLGQKLNIGFNWSVVYEYERSGLFKGKAYFTWKKSVFTGQHLNRGDRNLRTGINDMEAVGLKSHLMNPPSGVIIEWTQEREDFLTALENKFRNLSKDLDEFIGDLDGNKLDLLIANDSQRLFLNA